MEDKRLAASIHAGISSQIFAASLVLIGVLIGYLDIKNIEYSSLSGILTFISVGILLVSIILAGKGLQKLRDNGSAGNWDLDNLHIYFRLQTWLNFLAIILFFIIVFNSKEKTNDDKFQKRIVELELKQIKYDSLGLKANSENSTLLMKLNSKLDSLNIELEHLSCCKKRTKNPCP